MVRFNGRSKAVGLAATILVIMAWASSLYAQDLPAAARKAGFIAVAKQVQAFSAVTLSGDAISESSLRTGVHLIYVWSPKNDPKAAGSSNLAKIMKDYASLRILVLSGESADLIRPMVGDASMYPYIAAGARQAILAFGNPSAPAWLFAKSDGTIVAIKNGNFDPSSPNGVLVLTSMLSAFPADTTAEKPVSDTATPVPPALPPEKPVDQALTLNSGVSDSSFARQIELEIVVELNLARTNPKAYAQILRDYRKLIHGNYLERPGEITIVLNEGAKAVDEAITFLERQAPVPALSLSKGLSLAARDHAKDQGQSGATGHTGRDGSTMTKRIERYGEWQRTIGENIAYGPTTARDIVIQLIVDDGVPSRGHRSNIFKAEFLTVGISYAPHAKYGSVCVQDFAGGFAEK